MDTTSVIGGLLSLSSVIGGLLSLSLNAYKKKSIGSIRNHDSLSLQKLPVGA